MSGEEQPSERLVEYKAADGSCRAHGPENKDGAKVGEGERIG